MGRIISKFGFNFPISSGGNSVLATTLPYSGYQFKDLRDMIGSTATVGASNRRG